MSSLTSSMLSTDLLFNVGPKNRAIIDSELGACIGSVLGNFKGHRFK